jgi:4-oxalocrotonate tautomerase
MPHIQMELMDEIFTPVQKKELMNKLSDAAISIGDNVRSAAWFSIEEICNGEWRIG